MAKLPNGRVAPVFCPGLADSHGHAIAKKQMVNGFGGMLSFELKGGYDAGVQLMNNLEQTTPIVNLRNVDSLTENPASVTKKTKKPLIKK